MYADRHARPGRVHPGSLATSLLVTGAMIAGLIFSAPDIVSGPVETRLRIENIPLPVPPPPDPPRPMPRETAHPRATPLTAPRPQVVTPPTLPPIGVVLPPLPPLGPTALPGSGTGAEPTPLPSPSAVLPVLVEPGLDPRYAGALQPSYPAEERRAQREGRVVVRVLVGVDGRVREVRRVDATSDAFFAATRRQALAHWRFRPGTRDGIPVEAWRTMAVRFVLAED